MSADEASFVREQYATPDNLRARKSAYVNAEGDDPRQFAFEAVAAAQPRRVLEVGGGEGELAARIETELGVEVVGIDQSEAMVAEQRAKGIDARVGDVQQLPFAEGEFDVAVAAWMLYHVPDLDRGLAELGRVLRAGGRLVAVTNAPDSLHELWTLLGADRTPFLIAGFHSDNGAEILQRHFQHVDEREASGTVTFADAEAVQRYVDSLVTVSGTVPQFEGELICSRRSTIFVAEKQ